MRVCAIIAAAGSGSRMGVGKNKLLLSVKDKTVIERTIESFEKSSVIDAIIVVTADEKIKSIAEKYKKVIKVLRGGDTRQKSVYEGIVAADGYDVVAVHDGARCLISDKVIQDVVAGAKEHGACVPVVDIVDTLKKVKQDKICDSIDREEVKAIQTPQCFERELLLKAYITADGSETDESSLVAKISPVHTCGGERKNIKITTKFDLILANAILEGGDF